MPTYIYRAVTKNGQEVKNKVEDVNRISLIKKLKRNGLIPISVIQSNIGISGQRGNRKKKKNNIQDVSNVLRKVNTSDMEAKRHTRKLTFKERLTLWTSHGEKITTRDVMIFTQNFYLLKKSNFNNIHALNTIIESTEKLSFRAILEDILAGVEAGENMYVTMEYYTGIFPYIYINMIKVGELSGSLTKSLEQAIIYLDESTAMSKKVKSILLPNIIQFVGILLLLILGTLFAIPLIQDTFEKVGSKEELPALTIAFSNFLNTVIDVWYIPVFLIFGIAFAIVAYVRTPKGKYNFHYFKYTMPIFGKLIYSLDFERLMKAVLLNINNGVRIQDALEVSKNVVSNYVMLSIIETSINNILIGQSWIEPFEKAGLSTPMTTEMLKIGMQTDLSEMMNKMLDYLKIDTDHILEKIMKVMPQVVYSIVGVVLIFFVLVVLVPIIQVYMGTFLFSAAGV